MLNLHSASSKRWLDQVDANLEEVLIDHAHCEMKAARAALNMMASYIEREELCQEMTIIVNEELEHFQMVLDVLKSRGMTFRRQTPSNYGKQLHDLVRKMEPQRAVDRLLICSLIEARSCERFGLLKEHLEDRELAEFFGGLFESEARHHTTYVRLAKEFASEEDVQRRLEELAIAEAEILERGDELPRVHS